MATPKERIEAQLGLSGLPLAPIPREQPEVPDHELLRRIGLGSYGEVWLARNVVGQYRAVKVVYRDRFSDERPYEREFSGIQKYEPLSRTHQGLVQVLQIGRKDADGYFYYVMELADDAAAAKAHGGLGMGEFGPAPSSNFSTSSPTFFDPNGYAPRSLQHDLKLRGRLPAEDCVQLGLSLSLALGHLHRHGLIHRDVKPSNIIFVNGISKLADIGLVTEYAGANSFVGTEGFIPPEGPNSPQADLYGLGKVLYEASMGKDRQDFPEPFTALAVQEDSLALLELNAVVLRACATDIRERYQSAEEMHVDLALLQSGDSVRQKQALERRLARLKRVSTIGAAVTLVVTAAFLWQQHETRQMKKLALQNSDLARKSDQVAAESRKQLVKLQVANGIRQMEDGNLAACLPWFAEVLGNIKGDSSSEATYRLLLGSVLERCPKLVHVFQVDSPPSYCSFSPNGRTLACRLDSGVTVLEVTSGRVLFHIINANAGPPFFSPDGQRLIIGKCKCDNSPSWGIYDANTGGPIGFKQEEVGLNRKFLDSIDGSHVLLSDGDRTAQVFDLDTGESTSPAIQAPHRIVRGRFAKNQRYVALASTEQPADAKWEATETTSPPPQNLGVWDALTGQTIGTGLSVDGNSPVLLETDGRHVAVKAPDWTDIPGLRVFDTSTGQQVQPVPDLATDENFLISSHGQWVAGDHLTTQTRLWNFATGQTLTLNCPADFGFISFSADGLLVATSRGKGVTVWNAKTGEALLPLLPKGRGLALSADGHLLAICGLERALCIWDLASVRKPELAIRERDKLNDAVYSPDGRKLITLTTSASSIRVWDALTGKPLGPPLCDGGPTVDLKFSRNGQQFATFVGPGDRKRRKMSGESGIWIVKIGEMTTNVRLLETDHIEFDADFSPDGERIVTAGGYGAKVWDAKTDKLLLDLDREGKCLCAAFSPDGKQIVTSGESGVIRFWDATTGACLRKLERSKTRFETIAFSPDWHRMAVGASDETMQVVDSGNFAPATTPLRFSGGSPLRASFGPDGESLITFGPASFVLQWGIRDSGLRVPPLDYGQGSVVNAEFSPNGKFIVSCSDYGSTRVWNSAAGEPVIAPINNGSKNSQGIYTARFSPSGDRVITAGEDCVARVWAFHPCEYSQSQLTQLAQIISGQRLDSTGTLLPTDPKDIQTRFEELRVSLPHAFEESTAHEQAVWHEQMATEAARVRLWPSVIWHVDHAIKLDQEILQAPTFDEVIRLRGQAHAELGHWLEAQADFKLAVQLSPEKIYNRYDLMMALVAGGCTDEYQKEWNAAFTNFEWAFHRDVKQIRPAWGIVSALIHSGYWATNTTQNVSRALELGWMLTTNRSWGYMKSALLYRAGNLDKALEFAEQTRANVSPADETEWLVLAMIHAKVGHPVEARKFLNEAGKVWEQKVTKPEGESPNWWDRTEYQAMRQEAEAALEQSARASNRAD